MTSTAEQLLSIQLQQAGIPFRREVTFSDRRWRFDFVLLVASPNLEGIAIEIEGGSYTGGHKRGKAYESDCDKHNAAMDLGWKVYRFTPAHVEDGRALDVIRQALGATA
jgi:very-short-patch-repair endonuclease